MKLKLIILLFFAALYALPVNAQKMTSDYFDEAEKYYKDDDYENALKSFQYITKNHKKSDLYPRSLYNVAILYNKLTRYDSALVAFKTILKSGFDEKESKGGDIMDSPFANYKHNSAELISDIYYQKQLYDSALYYFDQSVTQYPFLHFCGNAYDSYNVFVALHYADIYDKLGKEDKAIQSLLGGVFSGYTNNDEVLDKLKPQLKKKPNILQDLDDGIAKIYAKKQKYGDHEYTNYYFPFFGIDMQVPDNCTDERGGFNKENTMRFLKNTKFYQMVKDLKDEN